MFLAITISNNFPNKPILLKSYKLSPIYTYRIGLVSKIEKPKVNKIISVREKTQSKCIMGLLRKGNRFDFVHQLIGFIQSAYYGSVENKTLWNDIFKLHVPFYSIIFSLLSLNIIHVIYATFIAVYILSICFCKTFIHITRFDIMQ